MEIILSSATALETFIEGCYIIAPDYNKNNYTLLVNDIRDLGFKNVREHRINTYNRGYLTGMNFQLPPLAQNSLIGVIKGSMVIVALDMRASSLTYGRTLKIVLTSPDCQVLNLGLQIYIPSGLAYGLVCLEDNTLAQYYIDIESASDYQCGVSWKSAECFDVFLQVLSQYDISESDVNMPPYIEKYKTLKNSPIYFH